MFLYFNFLGFNKAIMLSLSQRAVRAPPCGQLLKMSFAVAVHGYWECGEKSPVVQRIHGNVCSLDPPHHHSVLSGESLQTLWSANWTQTAFSAYFSIFWCFKFEMMVDSLSCLSFFPAESGLLVAVLQHGPHFHLHFLFFQWTRCLSHFRSEPFM